MNKKKLCKCITCNIVLTIVVLCTGCSPRELEDKSFPLAIGIDKEEEGMVLSFDFPDLAESKEEKNPSGKAVSFFVEAGAYYEAQKAYENNTNKVLDYNHLKAIVIGQEFVADSDAMYDLLSWLEHEEVVARNTSLFLAQGKAAEILTLTEGAGGSVGEYLEQMLETQEDFKENKIMTIGNVMNQWHDQNEILMIPVLTDNGGVPSITEYAVIDAFAYKGNISVEDAMKFFLCQGMQKQLLYHLKSGEVLEIQNIKTAVEITEEEGRVLVTTSITGEAEVKKTGEKGAVTSGWLEKQLNRQLSDSLSERAASLLVEPGIDISNSFYKLGGHDRKLYEQYAKDYAGYKKALVLQFAVEIDMVND